MLESLDRIDRKLLRELDHNSRRSISEISRKMRLGNDIVAYRLDRLQREGVINRFSAHIDVFRLGKSLYKTYLKLDAGRSGVSDLIAYINRGKRTYWLAEWYGRWDMVYSIWADHSADYQKTMDRVYSKFGDIILESSIVAPVETVRFPNGFGLGQRCGAFTYGKVREHNELDDLERGILRMLNHDARMSYVELAEALGSSASVVKYRLKKLEDSGIIFAYQVQLNYKTTGVLFFKLLIHLAKFDCAREKKLREFCRTHPNITCHIKQIGDWPIELEIEVGNLEQFHQVVDQLKVEFSCYIKTIDTLLLRADHYHRIDEVPL